LKTDPPPDSANASKAKGRGKKLAQVAGPPDNTPKGTGFIKLPAARGRIADNLVSAKTWDVDLFIPLIWDLDELERQRKRQPATSIERLWFQSLCYQRSKLMKLIAEDDMWDTEAEKVFVEAFWETLDALYAQEAAATERGGSRTTTERFEDLNDDIRRRLTQAKTRALLRTVLADSPAPPSACSARWTASAAATAAVRSCGGTRSCWARRNST
jgi:CRISPR-associated protein Cas8a1/Csx13